MGRYYDKDGTPMALMEWAKKLEDDEYKRVAIDIFENRFGHQTRVSTVWLGLDHSYNSDGPPLIFESMAFDDDDTHVSSIPGLAEREFAKDLAQERYSTLAEAQAGHLLMVAKYKSVE